MSMMPDRQIVRDLLRQIGMDVPTERIAQVHGGTVNTAFRIDQDGDAPLIIRVAPSDAEAAAGPSWLTSHGLRREQTTIRVLSDDIASLMPRTVHFDDTRALIDRDWVMQTWVHGDAWADVEPHLSRDEHLALWREMGRLVRGIHAIVGEAFGPPEAGLGFVTWSDQIRWDVTGFLVDAGRFGLNDAPFARLERIVDDAVPVLNRIREARLIHSDLGSRHVFVSRDADGRPHISGLIDFEFARFADPASESVFIDEALMPSQDGRDIAFCEGYGCDRPTRDDVLRRNVYMAVALGWIVTDMMRRNRPKQVSGALTRLSSVLDAAQDMM